VPLIDPRTGLIDRAWYLFFLSLQDIATSVVDDVVGPSSETLIASYDAALQALAQSVDTQPLPIDLSAELAKQIQEAGLTDQSSALLSQIAEMQKQLEALNLLPPPTQGTVTAVTATAPVVSSGGTAPDISMPAASTSVSGYLTSTDWNTFNNKAPATSGTSILYGNGTGGFSNVTIGLGVSFAAGTLSATGSGGTVTSVTGTAPVVSSGGTTPAISMAAANTTTNGYLTSTDWNTFNGKQPAGTYVTAVSIVSTNGFAGTSSGGATPALTLTTTITGLLKGNGTAISAATSGTDYAPATSGTSILYGNGAGGFSNVTVGTGLSFSAGTLASTVAAPSAPVTKTADFSVAATDVWLINNKSGSTCTVTLPTPSTNSGRVLYFQNYQVQALVSASSNVVPLAGGAATTSILLASSGDSATLVSDGTNWLMTQYIPNNILLLE
jgi:hypothetical protein